MDGGETVSLSCSPPEPQLPSNRCCANRSEGVRLLIVRSALVDMDTASEHRRDDPEALYDLDRVPKRHFFDRCRPSHHATPTTQSPKPSRTSCGSSLRHVIQCSSAHLAASSTSSQ